MKKTMLFAGFVVVLVAGCDNKPVISPMPEINDTNCQIESIKKIKDRATREKFAGLCSRRSPTRNVIKSTEKPENWLELADPKDQKASKP